MRKPIYIFILLVFMFSCSSDDNKPEIGNDYLIFGHFYGFCIGESCIETFKLTNYKLYEDSNDDYANKSFNFEALENEKFIQIEDLIDFFPPKLMSENKNVLGCPDCTDGGGLFIEYSKNGVVKNWRIDQFKENVPEYLHDFMDKVNEKISIINN